MSESIEVRREGVIATVSMSRPDRRNALDLEAWRRLGEVFREIGQSEEVRCVVLRGAGEDAFCAGADILEFEAVRSDRAQAWSYGAVVEDALVAVDTCRHPTLAMIRGACLGGGLEIAAACDLRVSDASALFGAPVNRLGITMAYGELRGLLGLIGQAHTLELLLEGRSVGVKRARQMGLVNHVFRTGKLERRTYDLAARIAAGAPLANRWHKRFVRRLAEPSALTVAERAESYAFADTEDYRTGCQAFRTRSRPEFQGR
jgi:enoyl-CoA hydratase/carnithine racemase